MVKFGGVRGSVAATLRGPLKGLRLGHAGGVSADDELPEDRRRRRPGDPRLSPEVREVFRRMTNGDLQPEFQAGLDASLAEDEREFPADEVDPDVEAWIAEGEGRVFTTEEFWIT